MSKNICIIGLGYVGLTLSLALAKKGYKVYGYDSNPEILNKLKNGESHIFEKDIDLYLKKYLNKNFFLIQKLNDKFITYIVTVGTPVKYNNYKKKYISDLSHVKNITIQLSNLIRKKSLIIFRSTLPVGTTRKKIIPIFRKKNLKISKDYFISYAPERTVEGNAINELETIPQIIAGYNKECLLRTKKIFRKLSKQIIEVDTLETAEIIKLINNTYRDLSFAYSNQIGLICQKYKISAKKTIEYSNYNYPRNKIPVPSPGVGGPCLTKDPYILNEVLSSNKQSIFTIGREINKKIVDVLATNVIKNINNNKNKNILILGISFKGKPLTKDARGSSIFKFYKILSKIRNFNIFVDDPLFSNDEIRNFKFKIANYQKKYDCIIFLNNNPIIKKNSIKIIKNNLNKDGSIFDYWSIIKDKSYKKKFNYFEIGN